MSDEAAFLRAIQADPADATAKLVYADWLDERGEAERAAYLRLLTSANPDPEAKRELESRVGSSWLSWLIFPMPAWNEATFYALGKLDSLLEFYQDTCGWLGQPGYHFQACLEVRSEGTIATHFHGWVANRFHPVTIEPIDDWVNELTRVFHKWLLSREIGTPTVTEWMARTEAARLAWAIDCVRDVLRPLRGWRGQINHTGWYAADWDHIALEAADRVLFLYFSGDD